MTRREIINEYFNWLTNLVCNERFSSQVSYNKLLSYLHDVDFRFSLLRDENRAEDGLDLRWRFTCEYGYSDVPDCLDRPCSVLEMMVALVLRCEETIMDEYSYGNRTGQWFWNMIINLGLGGMTDNRFDERFVSEVIDRFLDREYEPDGRGGLFTVKDCERDMRTVEIWHQMCWYLDSLD